METLSLLYSMTVPGVLAKNYHGFEGTTIDAICQTALIEYMGDNLAVNPSQGASQLTLMGMDLFPSAGSGSSSFMKLPDPVAT